MVAKAGFSLLELLIVLAITSMLAAVSFPLYQEYLYRSYRLEAMQQLLLLANKQELWLADYGRYQSDLSILGYTATDKAPFYYSVELIAEGLGYQLRAEAVQAPMKERSCRVLLLSHSGKRGALPIDDNCWL